MIEPVRGQIALLNPGSLLVRRILLWGAQYLVPRLDGRVLVGSTEEKAGFDKSTTSAGIGGLLELAVRLVPALASAAIETNLGWITARQSGWVAVHRAGCQESIVSMLPPAISARASSFRRGRRCC